MTEGALPSGTQFRRRIVNLSMPVSAGGLVIVLGFLSSVLEMTSAEWTWFAALILGYAAIFSYPNMLLQFWILSPVTAYLDRRGGKGDLGEARRRAFEAVIDLPRRVALVGVLGWVVPTALIGIIMSFRFEPWGYYEFVVILMSGIAAGFVSGSVLMFLSKGVAREVRDTLTAEIPDPDERRPLIRPLPLRTKVMICVTGVALVPLVFAVMVARSRATGAFETFVVGWQVALLDTVEASVADWAAGDYSEAIGDLLDSDAPFPTPVQIGVLDFAEKAGSRGELSLDGYVTSHLKGEVEAGVAKGSSAGLPSSNVFAWRRIGANRILVAATPVAAFEVEGAGSWFVYSALILGALTVAFGLALLIARDVASMTRSLQTKADRMASGDLRQGRAFESEDEIGELSRSFEAMALSLRTTVARVAATADRVETTAGEIAGASENVAEVSSLQVGGIREAVRSMEAIDSQVKDIAESSHALNVTVEESSSTILEMGAAGEELNDTASVLSTRVSEVSSSIEQMVVSVKQVSKNTEALSHAASETSNSMEEMVSSMREVDTSGAETAKLSSDVVETSEIGQAKVRQTIEGMHAIREATETSEDVIRNLGRRAKEIGAIVDVIDDVADETNLLALNAAIIAAQAGEHGRAFSVVADEIKDLSDRVLTSTKEIGALIASVQEESSNAIGAIERGTGSVAEGVDLSAESGVALESITRAARDTGTRIMGIVGAVREQAKAAVHVAELMDSVRDGVDEIRGAGAEQERGNEVVYRGAIAMREVAQQVRNTTEEQSRGSRRIRESVDGVRDAVEQINGALQEQSAACRSVVEFLEEVSSRTQSNEVSARRMDDATRDLLKEAALLREDVHRFRI